MSHSFGLFGTGDHILIAFSGGPDSTALIRILLSLREKMSLTLSAAHVNYRLRDEDSDQDEVFVRAFCKRHAIPLSVAHPKNTTGKNEEALREMRYRFFESVRTKTGSGLIATAHTEDDQAETVLLRLFRGSGMTGLGAIRPKNGPIIRPLIGIPKEDLLHFLREESATFRTDKTNRDTGILRNRIRHELLPLLEKKYQPGIRGILARTARILAEESSERYQAGQSLPITRVPGGTSFSRKRFLSLSDGDRSAETRRLYRDVSGTGKNPSEAFVKELKKMLRSDKNKVQTMRVGQLKVEAKGDTVVMINLINREQ